MKKVLSPEKNNNNNLNFYDEGSEEEEGSEYSYYEESNKQPSTEQTTNQKSDIQLPPIANSNLIRTDMTTIEPSSNTIGATGSNNKQVLSLNNQKNFQKLQLQVNKVISQPQNEQPKQIMKNQPNKSRDSSESSHNKQRSISQQKLPPISKQTMQPANLQQITQQHTSIQTTKQQRAHDQRVVITQSQTTIVCESPLRTQSQMDQTQGPMVTSEGSIGTEIDTKEQVVVYSMDKNRAHTLLNIIQILGFIIQVINIAVQIAYFTCASFDGNQMYFMYKVFLILRPIVIGGFTLIYLIIMIKKAKLAQDEYNKSASSVSSQVSYIQKNNFTWPNTILYILSYPIITYTGALRLIKHDHYLMSLRTNHLIELLSQSLPLLIVQTLNEQSLSTSQPIGKFLVAFAILNILNVLAEIFLDSHILRQKTISLSGCILCNCKSQVKEILLSLIIGSVLVVGTSFAFVEGFGIRQCKQGEYKDRANCISCTKIFGDKCLSCNGPDVCTKCPESYFFDSVNKTCVACKDSLGSDCLECQTRQKCSQCKPGMFIKDDKCNLCLNGCAKCSGKICEQCEQNYTMVNGTCQQCNKTLKYCETCSSVHNCTKCNKPDLTVLSNGTCGCPFGNNSYFDESISKCGCQDDNYLKNKTCSICTNLIQNCEQCSYSSVYSSGVKLDDGGSLQCKNCGYGRYLDSTQNKCYDCKLKFQGCALCGSLGSACTKCLPAFLGQTTSNKLMCVPCSDYMTGCKFCTSQTSCSSCLDNYNMVLGYCFKKWF